MMFDRPPITAQNTSHVQNIHTMRHRWVTALSWSSAFNILAVANAFDTSLYRFDGDHIDHQRVIGHIEPVRAAAISANGAWLVTGGDDSRVGVWNIDPQQPNFTHQMPVRGPVAAVAASPTQDRLAYIVGTEVLHCDYNGADAQIWRASERDLTTTIYSNDGAWLLAAGWDGAIRALDLTEGSVRQLDQQAERINHLVFNPAGDHLAAVSRAGRLTIYHWPTGEVIHTVDQAHDQKAIDVATYSPDGKLLATGGRDHLCRLWDAATLEPVVQLAAHRKPVLAVGFAPGGQLLATGSGDNTVRLWGVVTER